MLKILLPYLIATSFLCKASQQQEKPLSPRTQEKIEEARQELIENLTKIERAYIAATAAQHLITSNPRAWLFKKGQEALQACKLQESYSRNDQVKHEARNWQRIQEKISLEKSLMQR